MSPRSNLKPPADESHVSVASTVFWLLCVMCTIVAEVVVVATWLVGRFIDSRPLEMIHGAALFLCVVTSILGLVMVPVVIRVRDVPPPRSAIHLTYAVVMLAILFVALFR